jgi:type II secretion system protein H
MTLFPQRQGFTARANRNQRIFRFAAAFTLIELMVVIAIIAVMTAVIIPEMKGTFEDALLRSTARDLISTIDFAHSKAISGNRPHRIRIDTQKHEYVIEKQVPDGPPDEFTPLPDSMDVRGQLDARISVAMRETPPMPTEDSFAQGPEFGAPPETATFSRDTIVFKADGTTDAREIVLQDRTGNVLQLRINPITSRVRIVEGISQ